MFTSEELKRSPEYANWLSNRTVLLIHNYDSSENSTFIVITDESERYEDPSYTITRFQKNGDKININTEYSNLTDTQVFQELISKY